MPDPFVAYEQSKASRSQTRLSVQPSVTTRRDSAETITEHFLNKPAGKSEGYSGSDSGRSPIAGDRKRRRKRYLQIGAIIAALLIIVLVTVIAVQASKSGKKKEEGSSALSSSFSSDSASSSSSTSSDLLLQSSSSPAVQPVSSLPSESTSSTLPVPTSDIQISSTIPVSPTSSPQPTTQIASLSPITTSSSPPPTTSAAPSPSPSPSPVPDSSIPAAIVQARSAAGLSPLTWSTDLAGHAQRMAQTCCDGSCDDFDYNSVVSAITWRNFTSDLPVSLTRRTI